MRSYCMKGVSYIEENNDQWVILLWVIITKADSQFSVNSLDIVKK